MKLPRRKFFHLASGAAVLPAVWRVGARVKELTSHPAFTLKNPNKVYALLGGFGANQVNFHVPDGSGYSFMSDCPAASRLVRTKYRTTVSSLLEAAYQAAASR